jgi:hypothetical protein
MRPKNTVTNGGSTEILIQPYFFTLIDYTIGLVTLSSPDVRLYPDRIYGVTFHKITIFSTIYILFDSHWKYIIKRIYYNEKQIIIYWNEPLNNLEKLNNP